MANDSIDIVSMVRPAMLSDGLSNDDISDACISANQRGIRVRRILITFDVELRPRGIQSLEKAGIEVRSVSENDVPPHSLRDFVIVDSQLVFLPHYAEDGLIIQWSVSRDRSEIENAKQSFQALLESAL